MTKKNFDAQIIGHVCHVCTPKQKHDDVSLLSLTANQWPKHLMPVTF